MSRAEFMKRLKDSLWSMESVIVLLLIHVISSYVGYQIVTTFIPVSVGAWMSVSFLSLSMTFLISFAILKKMGIVKRKLG